MISGQMTVWDITSWVVLSAGPTTTPPRTTTTTTTIRTPTNSLLLTFSWSIIWTSIHTQKAHSRSLGVVPNSLKGRVELLRIYELFGVYVGPFGFCPSSLSEVNRSQNPCLVLPKGFPVSVDCMVWKTRPLPAINTSCHNYDHP